jgi:hypothetical protein
MQTVANADRNDDHLSRSGIRGDWEAADAKRYGQGYLQMILMEEQKLIEKHARALGLGDIKVTPSRIRKRRFPVASRPVLTVRSSTRRS